MAAPRRAALTRVALEQLGPDEGHEQVDKKQQRHESDEYVFHRSQPPARVRVRDADNKESDRHGHENQVLHGPPLPFPFAELLTTCPNILTPFRIKIASILAPF